MLTEGTTVEGAKVDSCRTGGASPMDRQSGEHSNRSIQRGPGEAVRQRRVIWPGQTFTRSREGPLSEPTHELDLRVTDWNGNELGGLDPS